MMRENVFFLVLFGGIQAVVGQGYVGTPVVANPSRAVVDRRAPQISQGLFQHAVNRFNIGNASPFVRKAQPQIPFPQMRPQVLPIEPLPITMYPEQTLVDTEVEERGPGRKRRRHRKRRKRRPVRRKPKCSGEVKKACQDTVKRRLEKLERRMEEKTKKMIRENSRRAGRRTKLRGDMRRLQNRMEVDKKLDDVRKRATEDLARQTLLRELGTSKCKRNLSKDRQRQIRRRKRKARRRSAAKKGERARKGKARRRRLENLKRRLGGGGDACGGMRRGPGLSGARGIGGEVRRRARRGARRDNFGDFLGEAEKGLRKVGRGIRRRRGERRDSVKGLLGEAEKGLRKVGSGIKRRRGERKTKRRSRKEKRKSKRRSRKEKRKSKRRGRKEKRTSRRNKRRGR
ncbi:MAG: uncharacterized protein A8A55_0085 [Amphiamblys sp. WSBS2006]|nr:MAG: uncharacterized protein A8A55_0085 [Amphiamblys sp. WSBS2006]